MLRFGFCIKILLSLEIFYTIFPTFDEIIYINICVFHLIPLLYKKVENSVRIYYFKHFQFTAGIF